MPEKIDINLKARFFATIYPFVELIRNSAISQIFYMSSEIVVEN